MRLNEVDGSRWFVRKAVFLAFAQILDDNYIPFASSLFTISFCKYPFSHDRRQNKIPLFERSIQLKSVSAILWRTHC